MLQQALQYMLWLDVDDAFLLLKTSISLSLLFEMPKDPSCAMVNTDHASNPPSIIIITTANAEYIE